jgi:transcription-repair coupling factor (superfamily II helicase)
VGRANLQAYAYLLVPPLDKITDVARKRLRAIQDFTELGSGYKIALRDLELRGAGNLLGSEQSGFVQSVGFELYCDILEEAVNEIKQGMDISGKEIEIKSVDDPKIDMDFDLLIPAEYISDELERISIYHRLVNFSKVSQIEELQLELRDRFGKIPQAVQQFLLAIEIKVLAAKLYAERIIKNKNKMKIIFSQKTQMDDRFFQKYIPVLINQKMATVRFLNQAGLGVEIMLKGDELIEQLVFAKNLLQFVVNSD